MMRAIIQDKKRRKKKLTDYSKITYTEGINLTARQVIYQLSDLIQPETGRKLYLEEEFDEQIMENKGTSYKKLSLFYKMDIKRFLGEELDDYLTKDELEDGRKTEIINFFEELGKDDDFLAKLRRNGWLYLNLEPETLKIYPYIHKNENSLVYTEKDKEDLITIEASFEFNLIKAINEFDKFRDDMLFEQNQKLELDKDMLIEEREE